MAIILQTKMNDYSIPNNPIELGKLYFSGYSIFWSGVTVGLANLCCGFE